MDKIKVVMVRARSFWQCHRLHLADCKIAARADNPIPFEVEGSTVWEIEKAVDDQRLAHAREVSGLAPDAFVTAHTMACAAGCCEKRIERLVSA